MISLVQLTELISDKASHVAFFLNAGFIHIMGQGLRTFTGHLNYNFLFLSPRLPLFYLTDGLYDSRSYREPSLKRNFTGFMSL